jgi:hypothetical protein
MTCKFQRAFDKNLKFLQISLILLKVFFHIKKQGSYRLLRLFTYTCYDLLSVIGHAIHLVFKG